MKTIKILTILLLIYSCNKDESISEPIISSEIIKEEILNASLSEQIEYKRKHMKILSKWVCENKNEVISQIVSSNQSVKGENYQLSLKDLVNIIKSKNKTSNHVLNEIDNSLNAFKNLGDESWSPVIFLEKGDLNSLTRNDSESKTYLAVEDETLESESIVAYEIIEGENDDNELVLIQEPFTEEFLGDNNLLVMELMYDDEVYSGGGGNSGGQGSNYKTLKLDKMTIRDLKEGWPFRSEISIKAYKLSNVSSNTAYQCGDYVTSSVNCYTYPGNEIVTLKRRWKNDERTYNWLIETSDLNSDDIVFYVIFEADWPAPIKTRTIALPNNSTSNIKYSSWQNIYDQQAISLNASNPYGLLYAYNFSADKSGLIKYNLK